MRDKSHSPGKFTRFIPKSHQTDATRNAKVERVKANPDIREILHQSDMSDIRKKYNVKLNGQEKETVIDSANGIVVSFEDGRFVLKSKR